MKKIEDYLHLYLRSEVIAPCYDEEIHNGYLTGVHNESEAEIQFIVDGNALEEPQYVLMNKVKLVLRPLSDMTEKEHGEISILRILDSQVKINGMNAGYLPEVMKCHLSKGFDLFGLIEAGLAIDKTKLIKP